MYMYLWAKRRDYLGRLACMHFRILGIWMPHPVEIAADKMTMHDDNQRADTRNLLSAKRVMSNDELHIY